MDIEAERKRIYAELSRTGKEMTHNLTSPMDDEEFARREASLKMQRHNLQVQLMILNNISGQMANFHKYKIEFNSLKGE